MILAVAALLLLPACWVYSVEPLYEEGPSKPDPDLVFDQTLVGSWGQIDVDCMWILSITADEPVKLAIGADKHEATTRVYELSMAPAPECKTDDKASRYQGHLVKLGKHQFLDTFPKSDEVCDSCLPLHSFFLVSQEKDILALIPMDRDWLLQAMKDKNVTLAHLAVHGEYDSVTLTASPRELKDFVSKHVDDKSAFKVDSDFKLKFKRR